MWREGETQRNTTVGSFLIVPISNCPGGGFGGPGGGFGGPGGGFRTGKSSGKPLLIPVLKKPPPGPPKPPPGQLELGTIRNELTVYNTGANQNGENVLGIHRRKARDRRLAAPVAR